MTTGSESLEIGENVYSSNHQNVFCLVHFNDMEVRFFFLHNIYLAVAEEKYETHSLEEMSFTNMAVANRTIIQGHIIHHGTADHLQYPHQVG